jgi:two-component system chemotaxis response regulator CheY
MDGMEMIAAIRADDGLADIPVIVVSTEGSQTRIDQLAAQGAKFIPKPFTPETVRNMVQEMLDTYGNDGLGGEAAAGDDTDF